MVMLQNERKQQGIDFRGATKRGKFSRAAWGFDVVLNSTQQKVPDQKLSQIYDIASIFKSLLRPCQTTLEVFNLHEIRGFNSTVKINQCTKKVFKKSIDEFCFNRCFRESSLRNYKKSSALRFTLIHTFSCVSKSRKSTCVQWLLRLQNE